MQVIAKGLDYSARTIPGNAIKSKGYDFVIRYVGFPGNKKCITPQEYQDHISNGIRVYAVYEFDINDSMGGYQGGVNAAKAARADMNRIGFPPNAICFFCADRHLLAREVPIAQQYINGAASVFGWEKTGAYGFEEFIWAIQRDNNCKFLWQCGAESYVREGVHFYQWNNGRDYVDQVECDINKQFIEVETGAPSGGSGRREKETMAGMAKGHQRAEVYMLTATPQGVFKRHIKEMEEVEFWQKQGMMVVTVDQAWVDKQWDATESVEYTTKMSLDQLLDDEQVIIQAIHSMPTGGQVDIPSFVSALVPVLAPALPQGVTEQQLHDTLVQTLNKIKLNVE